MKFRLTTFLGCVLICSVCGDSYSEMPNFSREERNDRSRERNSHSFENQSSEGADLVDHDLISRIVRLVNRNEAQTRFPSLGRTYPRENGFRGLVEPMFTVEMPRRVQKVDEFHDKVGEMEFAEPQSDFDQLFRKSFSRETNGRLVLEKPIVSATRIASFMLDDWNQQLSGSRVPKLRPFSNQ